MISKLVRFLEDNFANGVQMYNTRNTVGDYMYTIFHEGRIVIDYAPDYGYIEIFGLTEKEFNAICSLFDGEPLQNMPLPEVE